MNYNSYVGKIIRGFPKHKIFWEFASPDKNNNLGYLDKNSFGIIIEFKLVDLNWIFMKICSSKTGWLAFQSDQREVRKDFQYNFEQTLQRFLDEHEYR